MAWGKEVEVQRSKGMDAARKKAAAAAAGASSKTKLVKVQEKPPHKGLSSIVVLGAAGLLVGVRLCLRYKDEIRDTLRRLAKGRGDDSSNFRFPGVGRKANEGKAKAYRKAGAGTPVNTSAPRPVPAGQRDDTASSLPRNKASNNKKNKERKKDKKEIHSVTDADFQAKHGTVQGKGKGKTTVVATNAVPQDDDMVGGAAGKTFTTHQTMKVSTGYAKIRETVGKD